MQHHGEEQHGDHGEEGCEEVLFAIIPQELFFMRVTGAPLQATAPLRPAGRPLLPKQAGAGMATAPAVDPVGSV